MTPAKKQTARGRARPRTVGELMRRDFVVVSESEPLDEALRIMRLARLRHLLVERDGVLVGLLSYRDLQDAALSRRTNGGSASPPAEPARTRPVKVADAMLRAPFVVTPETTLGNAAARLFNLGVGCLPVVERSDEGPRLVGLITESDLLRAAYRP